MSSRQLTQSLSETLAVFDGSGEPRTTREVASGLDIGRRSTYERLDRLVESGFIETKKVGANARVWWRDSDQTGTSRAEGPPPDGGDTMFSRLVQNIPGMVYRCDASSGWPMSFVSDGCTELTGYEPSRVESDEVSWGRDVIHPADQSRVRAEIQAQLRDGEQFTVQYRIRTATDETRWVSEQGCRVPGVERGDEVLEGVVVDVTERERAQQDLVEQGQQLRSLVEATDEYAIFTLDTTGHVRSWNPGAERITGYERETVLGEPVSTFYTGADVDVGVPEADLAAAADDGSTVGERWHVRPDGERFWADVTITSMRDDDGTPEGFVVVVRDMTDRRQRERELRRERDLTNRLFETAPVRLAIFGPDGSVERLNSRARRGLGIDEDDVGSVTVDDLTFYDSDGNRLSDEESPVRKVLATGEPVVDQFLQHDDADGNRRWVAVTATPMFDDGTLERVVVACNDVTDLKRTERQLERQRDDLEHELYEVFDRVDDAFFAVDDEWRFTHVNRQAADVLDSSVGELIGRHIWEAFPGAVDTRFQAEYERAKEVQESVSFEEYFPPLDTWFDVTAYPSESGLSVYFQDVTDRKARERELERYRTIVETVDDGIYAVDEDARFVMVNEGFCELTGYSREELLGAHATKIHADHVTEKAESLSKDIVAGERAVGSIELDVETKSGDAIPCESRIAPFRVGDGYGRCGVVRDLSDRLERERELRTRVRQQEVVTELGQRALEDPDLDELIAEAAEAVAETLDNRYSKVLELDEDGEELLLRQGVGWDDGVVGETAVSSVDADSQAAHTLSTTAPVRVEDLDAESRFDGPDLLTDHDVRSGISTIVGSYDDPWGILGTHDTERKSFTDQDVNFVQSVANILAGAIQRHRHEQELVRQREHLAALDNLNAVVRDITEAVIEQSTREEIEETVCTRLAESDSYEFAWIGEIESGSQLVTLRTEAGIEGYLDDIDISVDPDDELGRGPTGRAFRTGEVQVTHDTLNEPRHDPWRDRVDAVGFRSSAAIPIVHDDALYGVLNVYARRPHAFDGQERAVVSQLGEVIGHAIASVERKRALMSDEVVEVAFRIQDFFDTVDVPATTDGTITLDQAVPVGDDEFLVYGTATPDAVETVEHLAEALSNWELVEFQTDADTPRFQVRMTDPPVLSMVASVGGYVDRTVIDGGDCWVTVHLAPTTDVRRVVDSIQEVYPSVEMLRRQQVSRTGDGPQRFQRFLTGELTDRQRHILEAAYHSGFFEWPREVTGEDLAASLDISAPTLHQHLRKAEKKVFESLLSTSTDAPAPAGSG
ncbi:PAS domain S-box protein [Haloarchaeobius sp. HRN-SO-5]|uniref:PAS domain S-box protein n=1 Tax=Haloarchaeobius sp. HRN-SO-5 TaxID=3446118 RepID=UPI003EBEE1EA